MKMQMIPEKLNDSGDCLCQCPADGSNEWCHCNDNPDGTGSSIENPIVVDLVWKEQQKNGTFKYFAVQSGNNKQNLPVVLPTATLNKRGVVQLTNDVSDREDLAVTPKGLSSVKATVDKETAERIANDNEINKRIDKEIADRGNADTALANRVSTLEQHEANHVTSVTSNGNATVTVTKQNGATNSFIINNVAHASGADNATNAGYATNADHATRADSATSATTATNAGYATNAGHATSADSATKATTADSATKAGTADVALVAKKLEGGESTGGSVDVMTSPAYSNRVIDGNISGTGSATRTVSLEQTINLSAPLPNATPYSGTRNVAPLGFLQVSGSYLIDLFSGSGIIYDKDKNITWDIAIMSSTQIKLSHRLTYTIHSPASGGSSGSSFSASVTCSVTNIVVKFAFIY